MKNFEDGVVNLGVLCGKCWLLVIVWMIVWMISSAYHIMKIDLVDERRQIRIFQSCSIEFYQTL
jgi:hypothetical protein